MLANHKSATDDLISLPAYISWYATRPTGRAHGKLLHLFKLLCNPPPMKASWLKHNFPYNERSKELGKKRDWMSIRLVGIDRMSWFSKYIIKLVNSNLGIRLNCLYNYHPTFISHIILNITAFLLFSQNLFSFSLWYCIVLNINTCWLIFCWAIINPSFILISKFSVQSHNWFFLTA